MSELLMSLLPWGVNAVGAVQNALYDFLPWMWRWVSHMGDVTAYAVIMPMVFWAVNRKVGSRVLLAFTISALLNTIVKSLFKIPRPFVYDSSIIPAIYYDGWSFPSGHAQLASAVWLSVALAVQKRWVIWTTLALTLFIALSRVVIAVHYPQDVIAGLVLGWAVALLVSRINLAAAPPKPIKWMWPALLAVFGIAAGIGLGSSSSLVAAGLGGMWAGYLAQPMLNITERQCSVKARLSRAAGIGAVILLAWLGHTMIDSFCLEQVRIVMPSVLYAAAGYVLIGVLGHVFALLGLATDLVKVEADAGNTRR